MNYNMVKLLAWLSGKKSTIVGLIFTTCSYLVLKGIMDIDTATYIGAMTTIITGVASYSTKTFVYQNK